MSEASFWRSCKKELDRRKNAGDKIHYQRFEDSMTGGIPDLNICFGGVETWVELKAVEWPKRPTTPVRLGLRTDQSLWLNGRQRNGGRALVLAKVGRHVFIFNAYFKELVKGLPRATFEAVAYHKPKNIKDAVAFILQY